ncbi:hypothetical protein COHA_007110 [Chlorella ohadii]|uniref:EamA domain-containing protein n=1 Tax=Chlorella ohadii TaxID=2649997 RepID=A0AAD5H3R3_9CHLO|nr:hypothetical protein COHA_007110 [Chlorella ohadii]
MRLAAAALGPARPQAAYARPICSASSAGKRFRRQKHRAVAPSKRSTAPDPLYDSAATLERLYLSAAAEVDAAAPPLAPAPAAAAGTHQRPQADAQQQAEAPGSPSHHRRKQLEVCGHSGAGLHVCVEHTIDEATGAEMPADPAVPLTGPAAWLAQLMDKVPLSKRTRGIIMLNLLVLLVATNWVVVKDVGGSFDAFGFAFLRFAVAAAAFSPFLKASGKDSRILKAGVEIGAWTAMGYIFQSAGLLTTDASRASFLSTFTVLVVPLLAGLSGKGVSPVTWASCVAALVGVGLLEQGGAPPGVGDIWSMLSAVAFGLQVFRTEHHARTLGNSNNLSLMAVVLATTMVFSGVAAAATHPAALADWLQNPAGFEQIFTSGQFPWQQVLYCGLLTTDLALLMEVLALQDVSSVEAAIIYTLEPVLGAAFAWVMLGERLGPKGFAGAAIILASSLVTQVLGSEPKNGREEQEEAADCEALQLAPQLVENKQKRE